MGELRLFARDWDRTFVVDVEWDGAVRDRVVLLLFLGGLF